MHYTIGKAQVVTTSTTSSARNSPACTKKSCDTLTTSLTTRKKYLPVFLTAGKTYLLPKKESTTDPSKYRPITCLQIFYKIMTSCIADLLNEHIEKEKIVTEEQKGSNEERQINENVRCEADKLEEWRSKPVHGRHAHDLNHTNVDKTASNAWLRHGQLFPETEGFMIAIQDQVISTNRTVNHNRPDIVWRDKVQKTAYLIDVAVPNTHNLEHTINEKRRKHQELSDEVKRMWNLEKVVTIPIVLSSTGIIPHKLHESLKTLNIKKNVYILIQNAVILNTTRIVRKFLS
ncbi:hypothetical protein M8J77_018419 [Diaphorina citri]|nr:hypothetical protein M8J77_018419 [Diaphorina citri]